MQDRSSSSPTTKSSLLDEVSKELEQVWKGKKDKTVPFYTPVAEKNKGAFVGSIYEKSPSTPKQSPKPKARWLGKLGMENAHLAGADYDAINRMRRGANRDAVKEKIASDCYYLLACVTGLAFDVPKARLAELPIINPFTEQNDLAKEIIKALNRGRRPEEAITKAVHVMSKWVNGYQDLSEAQVYTPDGKTQPYLVYLKETNCLSDTILVKGKIIPLEGVMELLAASRLLGDVDVLGNGGTNTGFVVQENLRGIPISAKIVKVDPGYAFTTSEESLLFSTLYPSPNPLMRNKMRTLKDLKDIQVGTSTDVRVYWSSLTAEQKSRFLKAIQQGMAVLKQEGTLQYLLSRNHQFNQYKDHSLMTNEIMVHYSDTLTLLLEKQEEIYGKHFTEILPDEKQLFEQLKTKSEKSEEANNRLKEALVTEKQNKEQIIAEKDKAHQQQQQLLLNQQHVLRSKEQELNAQTQQLETQRKETQAEEQKVMELSGKLDRVSNELIQKLAESNRENQQKEVENQQLNSEIVKLKQALQAANGEKLALKMQLNQAQIEKALQQQLFMKEQQLQTKEREIQFQKQKETELSRELDQKRVELTIKEEENVEKPLNKNPSLTLEDSMVTKAEVCEGQNNRFVREKEELKYDEKVISGQQENEHVVYLGTSSSDSDESEDDDEKDEEWGFKYHKKDVSIKHKDKQENERERIFNKGVVSFYITGYDSSEEDDSPVLNQADVSNLLPFFSPSSSTATTTEAATTATTNVMFPNPSIPQFSALPGIFHPASYSPSQPKLNQGALTYAQQVEMASKAIQDKSNQKDLTALLKWVTEGHLVEVEKLLKKSPTLALGTGTVTDRSNRTFNNITVLQYAAWALDAEMVELIIKYVGAHHSAVQMKALAESPQVYSIHGANYDMTPLVNKYQTYSDNYRQWDYDKRKQYWQKEIGGEQRKCPAWLIYAWSEEGKDVAWTNKDVNRKIKREYNKNRLEWWFTENCNNGRGVGTSWSAARGDRNHVCEHSSGEAREKAGVVRHDRKCVSDLGTTRHETLQRLMNQVESSLQQDTLTSAQTSFFSPSSLGATTTTAATVRISVQFER